MFGSPFEEGMFVMHKLTRFTAISVTAAALMAGGMLSSAASADTAPASSTSASSGPASTQSTWIVAVYATSAECRSEGDAMLVNKLIKSYQCLWDSPGFALWVTK